MTPGARLAAAIEILDRVLAGSSAEASLTNWARASRFAGSKDRAAVRDHVFDGLRSLRSYACLGGGQGDTPTGRAVILGLVRAQELDEQALFSGIGYAPHPPAETEGSVAPKTIADRLNLPPWLIPDLEDSLGRDLDAYARASSQRAPITLRVNPHKASVSDVEQALLQDGIAVRRNSAATQALTVIDGARRLRQTEAFQSGFFEFQDAHSQAVVEALPLSGVTRVLDYCAGGGGKSLALAAAGAPQIHAHDVSEARMQDIPARAARAGVNIECRMKQRLEDAYDLVLVDAPCSGSGSWRRAPDAKWRITPESLNNLRHLQRQVLIEAADKVASDGSLYYVTCSVLKVENTVQVHEFVREFGWQIVSEDSFPVTSEGDGFHTSHLKRV